LHRQRGRPIGDLERDRAFAAIAVVLLAAVLVFALPGPTAPGSRHAPAPREHVASVVSPPAVALGAARRFLDGYLAFAYGRGPETAVRGATDSLAATLARHAQPVPPALQGLHPRIVALRAAAAPGGRIVVTALIKDGEVVEYPITVLLAVRGGRYFVAGLGSG
jgi:hypothetical protein